MKELGDERVALLTGTIRGHERDALVRANPVYRALLDPDLRVEKSVYLVSTSAGEVGIDLDADHLVCDLTTLDALIQRLGRVNRRGGKERIAHVDVVVENDKKKKEKPSEVDGAIAGTLALLDQWKTKTPDGAIRVGPQALRQLLDEADHNAIEGAFSPRAAAPLLTDVLLDTWSLTSIDKIPGRIDVAPFLHGLTSDPPETLVAWRCEISILHEAGAEEATLRDWFRACRIEAREKLRDRTDRVKKTLAGARQSSEGGQLPRLPGGVARRTGACRTVPALIAGSKRHEPRPPYRRIARARPRPGQKRHARLQCGRRTRSRCCRARSR